MTPSLNETGEIFSVWTSLVIFMDMSAGDLTPRSTWRIISNKKEKKKLFKLTGTRKTKFSQNAHVERKLVLSKKSNWNYQELQNIIHVHPKGQADTSVVRVWNEELMDKYQGLNKRKGMLKSLLLRHCKILE